MITLHSPLTGVSLAPDTPHSLAGGGERWPVIDGIAYLRGGSQERAAAALDRLDKGDHRTALALLLIENDPWWDGASQSETDALAVVDARDRLTLRGVMRELGWGRVGDYFAHRWSDPTFLAGLALLDAHWTQPRSVLEIACGIGHYLRALGGLGVSCIGVDVVFAKLWVARHWVSPDATLVAFDAESEWPLSCRTDLAMCMDAFYFLRRKQDVVERMRGSAPSLVVSHVHNRERTLHSPGAAITRDELEALFPRAVIYDDAAMSRAAVLGEVPRRGASHTAEAFSLVEGPAAEHLCAADGSLYLPREGTRLVRNPLCRDGRIAWPSKRYEDEYAETATYTCTPNIPEVVAMSPRWSEAARRRDLVELPERW